MPAAREILASEARPQFRRKLSHWYRRNRRDLPWREDRDPYRVWLSEIMLQQTRVAAVIEHYRRFLLRFPSVEKLACSREASVLAAWSGLGYYRRARMLHSAARTIVKQHQGKFPDTAEQLRDLPGIGRYTAAAIASISFGQPVAVLDGNVERVLQRLLGRTLTGEKLWKAAEDLLDRRNPGDHNQAMMELGATLCLPRQPLCLACPVSAWCSTRGEIARPKTQSKQKKREIHYVLSRRNGSVFLTKRPKDAQLMAGFWELPEVSAPPVNTEPWLTLRHSITVTDYTVKVVACRPPLGVVGNWVRNSRLLSLPLTGLARKILRAAGLT
jgi:A/G-specific adenine glycosylase